MRIAVVDGVGSGRWLTRELTGRGAECVHVKSRPVLPPHLEASFRPGEYALDLGYDHNIGRLATRLRNLGVVRIAAGHACGVPTAQILAGLTGLPGMTEPTGPDEQGAVVGEELQPAGLGAGLDAASGLPWDRRTMARRLYEAGLDAPLGTEAASPEAGAAWFADAGLGSVGAVVRPAGGAGPEQVYFCRSAAEVHAAVAAVLGTPSAGAQDPTTQAPAVFGGVRRTAIVQELLTGPEFSVDTVAAEGVRLVAETWRHTVHSTPSVGPLADFDEPADPRAAEIAALHGYVLRALDALGIRHGAAHSRVVLSPRGPVLVDPGPGLADGVLPWVAEKFLGYSHTGLFAESILAPRDLARHAGRLPEPWPEPMRRVVLVNRRPGIVRPSAQWTGALEALPTAIAVAPVAGAGLELPVTRDAATSPGFVYLSAADPAWVERDYLTIREWEQQGPYTA
ncbi:MAG: hypothetical protein HOV87_13950 [Catenulispora sp.]|nr:hypothetical protein [Catenulispora sp.]